MTVDDQLPVTTAALQGQWHLFYAQQSSEAELWPALYEKAFAKIFGGYCSLSGNTPALALKALTGCVGEKLLTLVRDRSGEELWRCNCPTFEALQTCTLRSVAWPHMSALSEGSIAEEEKIEGRDAKAVHQLLKALMDEGALICAGESSEWLVV